MPEYMPIPLTTAVSIDSQITNLYWSPSTWMRLVLMMTAAASGVSFLDRINACVASGMVYVYNKIPLG